MEAEEGKDKIRKYAWLSWHLAVVSIMCRFITGKNFIPSPRKQEEAPSQASEVSKKVEAEVADSATVTLPKFSLTIIGAQDFGIPETPRPIVKKAGRAAMYDKMRGPIKSGWDQTMVELLATPQSRVSDTYLLATVTLQWGLLFLVGLKNSLVKRLFASLMPFSFLVRAVLA